MRRTVLAVTLLLVGLTCLKVHADNLLGVENSVTPSGGCSQATSFISRSSITGTDATNYTNLICGLVTDGVWNSLDALYIFAAPSSTVGLLNLVSSSYNATNNATTFTAYRGFANSTTNTIDTNFNPTTAVSPNYTLNSAHAAVWNNTNGNSTNSVFLGTSGAQSFFPQFNDGNVYTRVNDTAGRSGFSVANPHGLAVGTRENSTAGTTYFGLAGGGSISSLGTTSQSSNALENHDFFVFAGADVTHQIAMVSFGADLTSTQVTHLYNRVQTYMTAVGN